MTRYEVVHTSTFEYSDAVTASYNEARLTPAQSRGQVVESCTIAINPCTYQYSYTDYWGTAVSSFEVLAPHQQLCIQSTSVVRVTAQPPADDSGGAATWEDLRDPALRDRLAAYLDTSTTTRPPEELAEIAADLVGGHTVSEAARAICLAVHDHLEYVPGVTTVHTPARDAWQVGKGVCQDLAHLSVGALRSVGIPALYVSGYTCPPEVPSEDGSGPATLRGESHAWVEWWADGWVGFDPTSAQWVGSDHVVLARGREYGDVPPLKGVYAGAATSDLDVEVLITRLAG